MAWRLIDRSLAMRRDLDRLNRGLETRVAATRAELEHSYGLRYGLEREQAKLEERERIHRDLHDDLGAKLLTLVHASGNPGNVELARSALADLREVVSLNPEDGVSLRAALSETETEARLRAACLPCRLDWHYRGRVGDLEVPAGFAFHLGRILREAIGNALAHAAPQRVEVELRLVGERELRIEVWDDGCGCEGVAPGGGMLRMRSRAAQLQARLRWLPRGNGGPRGELDATLPSDGSREP
jgi:two-component system sensor histidine kinase UhpB